MHELIVETIHKSVTLTTALFAVKAVTMQQHNITAHLGAVTNANAAIADAAKLVLLLE